MTDNNEISEKGKKSNRALKIFGKIILVACLLLLAILLFVRSPWGQDIIVNKAVSYVSNKTNTEVQIEKLYITFGGNVKLDGLYLEDTKGDTLVYSKSLEANVPLWKIISGKAIGVDALHWSGLRANIIRKDSVTGYNFQFLIDALSPVDTTSGNKTSKKPLDVILGDLNFEDFDVVFNDGVAGIKSHYKIGSLHTDLEHTDLDKMAFEASNIKLKNSNIDFIQKPTAKQYNSQTSRLPLISVANLNLVNVKANYQSFSNDLAIKTHISDLLLQLQKADLASNTFEIDGFRLKDSKVSVQTERTAENLKQTANSGDTVKNKPNQPFEWPNLNLTANHIDFENNAFSYSVKGAKATKDQFSLNDMAFKDFNLKANNIKLKDKAAKIQIDEAQFTEASGLNLKYLNLGFSATDKELMLKNFNGGLNNTTLNASLKLAYPNLSALAENSENSNIELRVEKFQIAPNDVLRFQPKLKDNAYLKTLSTKSLTGNLFVNGKLSNLSINKINTSWGNTSQLSANGTIQNITKPDSLQFNIPEFSLASTSTDIVKFIDEAKLGINLPKNARISGNLRGNLENVNAQAKLKTSQGLVNFDGSFKNNSSVNFDAQVSIEKYRLDQLLKNDQLGALSASIKANGAGKNINTLNADFSASVSNFNLNNYNISDLNIDGKINAGKGDITSSYKDQNLNMNLNAQVLLDSVASQAHIDVNVIEADLQALGFMQRHVKTGMKISADFKGNTHKYNINALVDEGVLVYNNKTYLLGDFSAKAFVQPDTTSVTIKNKVVDATLQSNTDPTTFSKAIQRHTLSYFYRDTQLPDSITNPVKLNMHCHISQAPILTDLFFVNLKDIDTVTAEVNFNEKERLLKAKINAPHINYSGLELDSLAFVLNTDKEQFNFNLGFNEIKAGPINIEKTAFKGVQQNNELELSFQAFHNNKKLINILSKITGHREELHFHVLPKNLILNKQPWQVPQNNEAILTENKLSFNNFLLKNNNQSVEITDQLPETTKEHIAVNFKGFNLSTFLNYLNPDKQLATGQLNGYLILENPFAKTGIVANLDATQLNVLEVNLGTLTIDAQSLSGSTYDFNSTLNGGEIDLGFNGNYVGKETEAILDLNLDINQFNMEALAGFSQGEITNADGSFSGNFKFTGSTQAPKYNGDLHFNNSKFKVTRLDADFELADETLTINNKGVSMENFTIRDQNQNTFNLSGTIGTASLINPTFDLEATANNFQFLNATEKDNDFLYGTASLDADAKITGDLQIPKIDIDMKVGANTNATYVMPSAVVNIEERDGVVQFVNRENKDAILTRTEEETVSVKGYDINAKININPQAAVTILIDEKTGDNFKVSGSGDLNFAMTPNGNMTLSGVYEAQNGHYEMNLYNLVNRKFTITPGSQVTWSGDPFDAKLNVRAIYELKTSASALMAPAFSDSNSSAKNKFRQVLPFQVYLNIGGQLMQPKINFNLDMPQDEQGAIGGQVYGRVQQLNQRPDELNRQVFSLLVLNRFYPDSGSDGSSGGVASLARNNINDAVSDQLNIFSDRLLGDTGFELDFGFDSYTDYQGNTPQERTQLDIAAKKKLFNDRLIVSVGSEVDIQGSSSTEEETPLIGNVSLEYLLTENGRYRLKGFRRNEFENVIDGQTIVSGIAVIFTQEFNKFSELWDAMFKSQAEKSRLEDSEKQSTDNPSNKEQ